MSSKILSVVIVGLECDVVEVEADNSPHGNPGVFIVGLADKAVDESKSRVRSAIKNSGLAFPRGNVTINLAPADVKKSGTYYDVPIAISCLMLGGDVPREATADSVFVGELALDGSLRPVNGILSVALMCKERGIKKLYVPQENALEASLVGGFIIYPVATLADIMGHLQGTSILQAFQAADQTFFEPDYFESDMAYIKGQEHVKRALEIAAAGSHNVLMSGPPGSGKTMLAKAMSSILPKMTMEESLEVTRIYSAAGLLPAHQPLMTTRPFRSPHHTASGVALVGGGSWPKPGEISLAHRGVLFLDEFLEFPKTVLENLRQPLEDGRITISRATGTLKFPAKFILVAAMNPCPCGFFSDPDRECSCTPQQIIKYQKKVSGPLLDRIDLHVEVPRVTFDKLEKDSLDRGSKEIRESIELARGIQYERFSDDGIIDNSEMSAQHVKKYCVLDTISKELLRSAVERFHLSARSYFRLLKLSRTIADLSGSEKILIEHVAESLQYRPSIE